MTEAPGCVLVADDSAVVRLVVRATLEARGYSVLETSDGEGAVAAVQRGGVDVVLLDVEMPGLSGYEVLAHLKENPATADIPVVFLTGLIEPSQVVTALRAGAHDYLRKPAEPAELVARVQAAIRVKHLQDELTARNEELLRRTRTDILTGLPNRRYLETALSGHAATAQRFGMPLSVLLLDVDRFKQVNDGHGHPTGDAVLRGLATRLESVVRAGDHVGRWGGEEFCAVLPLTTAPDAEVLGERLLEAVRREPIAGLSVTVSIGIAELPADGDIEQMLRHADEALYAAKHAGRDRLAVARATAAPATET